MHGKGKSQGEAIATVFEVIREKILKVEIDLLNIQRLRLAFLGI